MGLENPTFISQLVSTNPISTDFRSEGDDHLRRLKAALQNTFPNANRSYYPPNIASRSTSGALSAADENSHIRVNTSAGPVTLDLPGAGINGWRVWIEKITTDTNPIFIAPPAGTISSGITNVAKARRCVAGAPFMVFWDGSSYVVERCVNVPVGTILDFSGSALPPGYEWPNGQTLSSVTDYPEYFAVFGSGVTVDMRGRVGAGRDILGGAAANRLTAATMTPDGQTLGAVGGTQQGTISIAQLPIHQPTMAGFTFSGTTEAFTPAGSLSGTSEAFTPAGGINGNGTTVAPSIVGNTTNVNYTDPGHKHVYKRGSSGAQSDIVAPHAFFDNDGDQDTTNVVTNITIPIDDIAGRLSSSFNINTAAAKLSFAGTSTNAPLGVNAVFTGTSTSATLGANAGFAITMDFIGSGNPVSVLQPTIALNKILVVE